MQKMPAKNIDEYIALFPAEQRDRMIKLRDSISKAAPGATEKMSYAIPTFELNGNLVHFAAYKNHIGFYPGSSGIMAFKKELSVYESSKGAVQFPHDKPLPLGLVTKIVKFRVKENAEKAALKTKGVKTVKAKSLPDEEEVSKWLSKLNPAVKKEIDAVRTIIKAASAKLKERIKWNAPSYYHRSSGEDLLTFGPYKEGKILLVFHHPSVVKIKSALLEGNYKDRRLVYFKNKAEAEKNKKETERIIKEMIRLADKI